MLVSRMIDSADGGTGLLHKKITRLKTRRRGEESSTDSEKRKKRGAYMPSRQARCEEISLGSGNDEQSIGSVTRRCKIVKKRGSAQNGRTQGGNG